MNCSEVNTLVLEAISGSLDDVRRRAFEQHLDQCEPCREMVACKRIHNHHLKEQREYQSQDDFWQGFHKKISRDINQPETLPERFDRWRLTNFPAAFCQFSTLGLLKVVLLGLMVTLSILLFRDETELSHAQDPVVISVERDSTGTPLYQALPAK